MSGLISTNTPSKWGMVIDQDLCMGCQACVTACAMENNISFIGEQDVSIGRSMQWIHTERFWTGQYPAVSTNFQPIVCQQCGNAPCESTCPVYASVHSDSEDINAQIYNRCVGTRYCANNCPYQVRVFNWRDYSRPVPLNNQLNPDVTVRRRGIMEKCTFCIQRIRRTEETAQMEGRQVQDGEVEPACVQACPAYAIVFGRLDDPNSRVSQLAKQGRAIQLLEELGTQPKVIYLTGDSNHGHNG
ncbi:MAG: 4Fe-4S dicluster domain-containing protein [Anaerolineales bacterium]|jgi:molybdopterin-containing oxidoreductase family iron-sulfur binding subunit